MDAALAALTDMREEPIGTIRILSGDHAASILLLLALERLVPEYLGIRAVAGAGFEGSVGSGGFSIVSAGRAVDMGRERWACITSVSLNKEGGSRATF
jgi:hypothetical protein